MAKKRRKAKRRKVVGTRAPSAAGRTARAKPAGDQRALTERREAAPAIRHTPQRRRAFDWARGLPDVTLEEAVAEILGAEAEARGGAIDVRVFYRVADEVSRILQAWKRQSPEAFGLANADRGLDADACSSLVDGVFEIIACVDRQTAFVASLTSERVAPAAIITAVQAVGELVHAYALGTVHLRYCKSGFASFDPGVVTVWDRELKRAIQEALNCAMRQLPTRRERHDSGEPRRKLRAEDLLRDAIKKMPAGGETRGALQTRAGIRDKKTALREITKAIEAGLLTRRPRIRADGKKIDRRGDLVVPVSRPPQTR